LLVVDPLKRITLEDIEKHSWIVKHCIKGERATQRESTSGKERKPAIQQ